MKPEQTDSTAERPKALEGRYANYLEIGTGACEIVLDFGQAYSEQAPALHTRIVTNPLYARAFVDLLRRTLQNYERECGPNTPTGS